MIEEKPMEIALATDNPYEVLEQAKNMNDIGCYFLDIQLYHRYSYIFLERLLNLHSRPP